MLGREEGVVLGREEWVFLGREGRGGVKMGWYKGGKRGGVREGKGVVLGREEKVVLGNTCMLG